MMWDDDIKKATGFNCYQVDQNQYKWRNIRETYQIGLTKEK